MADKYLTTSQAAMQCSVTPDTVLRWVRSGRLPSRRTAGGHHRIHEKDLQKLLGGSSPPQTPANERQFQYCWEYNGKGRLLDGCRECAVYLMRAQRCYEVARLAPEIGPSMTFCVESCEDCDFYKLVQGQKTNVLVVTDDPELIQKLKETEAVANFNLQIADSEYTCATTINHFRPDFAVVDYSPETRIGGDIVNHLIEDSRVPFVRVVLATDEEDFPEECEEVVFARLNREFGIEDINACIEAIKSDDWEKNRRK